MRTMKQHGQRIAGALHLGSPHTRACGKISLIQLGLMLLVPALVLLIASTALLNRKATENRVQSCLEHNGKRTSIQGVIRQAGPTYFVYSDRWKAITHACNGRGAASCRAAKPGIVALENNIGRPVTVEVCENDVIAYTVADKRYDK